MTNTRSRLGCLTCRKKKKKCDQIKPRCGLCSRRQNDCRWPDPSQKPKPVRRNIVPKFILYDKRDQQKKTYGEVEVATKTPTMSPNFDKLLTSPSTFDAFVKNMCFSTELVADIMNFDQFDPPLLCSPGYPLVVQLDQTETDYFEYYCNFVAPSISVVSKDFNYFLNIFLPMAYRDESIIYAMIAWGCIFKLYAENLSVSKHSGIQYINKALRSVKGKSGFISSLTTYIILMCIDITTGSTLEWSFYLTNCYDLINEMGGFSVLRQYDEGKVVAENFAYFDILASQSNENGTYYPVVEYNSIFNSNNTGYIDSLSGCTRPLILILGDVINLVVETNNLMPDNSQRYFDALQVILTKTDDVERRLARAKIYDSDWQVLSSDGQHDVSLHDRMFELYRVTIELYVKSTIRRLPPTVPEIQVRVNRALRLLESLMDSSLIMGLCFPLLVVGVNSVIYDNRAKFKEHLINLSLRYEFNTVYKIRQIVEEVWMLNENGTICVDYFKVTKRFGWKLNIGR